MALVLGDRVRDVTTTTGTGTITLSGTAPNGYRSFASGVGNGNTTYYTIANDTEYEVGLGTFTSSGNTLSRTTVFASSNSNNLVNFSAGTKDVFVTYPAAKSIADGYGTLPAANGGTGLTSSGAAGNVLTSNGTTWTSAAPSGSSFQAIATGTLADGSAVVINADGTVSAIIGPTNTVFESGETSFISATYDANAQKVVIAYTDVGNSDYGTAVVGTVSGTSISFGTPVVFNSAGSYVISAVYDANAQKVVIAYDNNGIGTAIVGTVSGTSISFGTAVVFNSAGSYVISAVYDANAQKVVIAYQDDVNALGTAIVGTVSGTSISFGTEVVFNSAITSFISATYDTTNQKVVIAYRDVGNSNYGTAIVGTVSGTSISYGTEVVFNSETTNYNSAVYDANAQKVVIAYTNGGSGSAGTAIVGTVSGTSISFGTAVVFSSGSNYDISAVYDASTTKIVIAYPDPISPFFGKAIIGTVSGTSISFGTPTFLAGGSAYDFATTYDATNQKVVIAYVQDSIPYSGLAEVFVANNLTTENFIGFSNAAYTNGQTATIQIVGAVDDAQSSLTAGQSYFVQLNGALGLAPAPVSVFAGTAVAATKIIVKG